MPDASPDQFARGPAAADLAATSSRTLFESGFYCAESVLIAMAEAQGLESDVIPRIATGFCGGVARTGGQCGAVSGAIMGLGLAAGRDDPQTPVDAIYELVQSFLKRFTAAVGSTSCRELTGCDLSTDEGRELFHAKGLLEKCTGFTEEAARIAVQILEERS